MTPTPRVMARDLGLLVHRFVGGPGSVDRGLADPVVIDPAPVNHGLKLFADFDARISGDFGGGGDKVVRGVGKMAGFVADYFCFGSHRVSDCWVGVPRRAEGRVRFSRSGNIPEEPACSHGVNPYRRGIPKSPGFNSHK